MTKEQSCEQRIGDRLRSRLEDIEPIGSDDTERMRAIFNDYGWPNGDKTALDEPESLTNREIGDLVEEAENKRLESIREGVLSIDKSIVFDICLKTGGPEDGFRIFFDPESREFVRGEYYFKDWFDGARRSLSNDELDAVVQAYSLDCYVE